MIRKFVTKNISLPLYDYAKGLKVRKYYKFYKETLKWSRSEIKEYQFQKLKKLLIYAYENTNFYANRFKENNLTIDSIKSIEDLSKIPPLTRTDVQANIDDLIAKNFNLKKAYKGASSGSTGQPVFYYHDTNALAAGQAAHYLGWSLAGWEFGDRGLHIWGNPTVVNYEWKKFSSKLKAIFFNYDKFAAYKLIEAEKFEELLYLIKKRDYIFLDGYTNAIYLFAKYVKEKDIKLRKFKYIFTTAENLHDYQRDLIKDVLGPIYDEYACGEILGVAYECKFCKKYHITDPHVVVEFDNKIVTNDGSKSLLITDLDNYAMPLIRYQNGDLAVQEKENNCKIRYNSISSISGRTSDIINLPEGGNLVVPSFFGSTLLKRLDNIIQYQIERVRKDKIIVKLVVNDNFNDTDKAKISISLKKYLKDKINWELKIVDKIPINKSNKFKLLIDKTKNMNE